MLVRTRHEIDNIGSPVIIVRKRNMDQLIDIMTDVDHLLTRHDFQLQERSDFLLSYVKNNLEIRIGHNVRENSNIFFYGVQGCTAFEITDRLIKECFKSDVRVNDLTLPKFAENLYVLLSGAGKVLLDGDIDTVLGLLQYQRRIATEYSNELLHLQYDRIVEEAWRAREYQKVIEYLLKIGEVNMTRSQGLKLEIARRRVE